MPCIQPLCPWGRPHFLASERAPTPDIYSRFWGAVSVSGLDHSYGDAGDGSSGVSAIAGVQMLTPLERLALRVRASGTEHFFDSEPGAGETRGYAALLGARVWLPDIEPSMRWAVVLDAEYAGGLDLARSIAPVTRGYDRALSFAGGLAMSGMPRRLGPVTWFARYLHSEGPGLEPFRALDFGLGGGAYIGSFGLRKLGAHLGYRYTHELASPGYRAHEIDLGFSFRVSDPLAFGIDGDLTLFTRGGNHRTVALRFDYYWESNY